MISILKEVKKGLYILERALSMCLLTLGYLLTKQDNQHYKPSAILNILEVI